MAYQSLMADYLAGRKPQRVSMMREETPEEAAKRKAATNPDPFPHTSNTLALAELLGGDKSSGSSGSNSGGMPSFNNLLQMKGNSGGSSGGSMGGIFDSFNSAPGQGWSNGSFTPAASGLGGGLMAVPGGAGYGTAAGGAAHSAGVMAVPGGLSNAAVTGGASSGTGSGFLGGMFGGGGGGGMAGLGMAALPLAIFAGGMYGAYEANEARDDRLAEWRNRDPEGYAKEMAIRKERNRQGVIEEQERKRKQQAMAYELNLGRGEGE